MSVFYAYTNYVCNYHYIQISKMKREGVMSKLSIFVMSELNVYLGVLSSELCLTQVVK